MGAKTMVAGRIVEQSDRILIYEKGHESDLLPYHVIAEVGTKVNPGDKVEYEPGGVNFGWFVRVEK